MRTRALSCSYSTCVESDQMVKRKLEAEKDGDAAFTNPVSASKKKKKASNDRLSRYLSLVESEDTLVAGLTYFLTSVWRDGASSLLDQYLDRHPDCGHILRVLEWDKQTRTQDVVLLCFQCLKLVLLHTASSPPVGVALQPAGVALVQAILRDHMKPIYSSLLTRVPNRLIAAGLQLLVAMVMQGPGAAREVQRAFNFSYKPLQLLLGRTHRVQGSDDSVRVSLIKFALSFLIVGDAEVIKEVLSVKGFLSAVFKLLPTDTPETVHSVLSTLRQKVVLNPDVSKRTKSLFFSQFVLKQTAQILLGSGRGEEELEIDAAADQTRERNEGEEGEGEGEVETVTLKQFTYDFLLELCTDFSRGICYKMKDPPSGLERTTNPSLLWLLVSLLGSLGNALVRQFVVRVVSACPDLLLPFLSQVNLSFAPRPSSKWLSNMDFLVQLYSSLPASHELLGASCVSAPAASSSPLSSCVDVALNLSVPSVTSRAILSQGIQNSVHVVQLEMLRVLQVALERVVSLLDRLDGCSLAGSEFVDLYSEAVLKSLPDVKTLIAVRHNLLSVSTPADLKNTDLTNEQKLRNDELAEDRTLPLSLTLQVLLGYQRLFSAVFLQADFKLDKLLPAIAFDCRDQCESDPVFRAEVLVPTLQLLQRDAGYSLNWKKESSGFVLKLLWLLQHKNASVAELARSILVQRYEGLGGLHLELETLLLALSEHSPLLHTGEELKCVVEFVAVLIGRLLGSRLENKKWLSKRSLKDSEDHDLQQKLLVKEVLDRPLQFPSASDLDRVSQTRSTEKQLVKTDMISDRLQTPSLLLELACTLESAHLNAVLPFLLEAVLRLFHASKCSQAVASQMLQLLESEEFVYNSCHGSLVEVLRSHFCSWASGFHTSIQKQKKEVDAPSRKLLRRLVKLSEEAVDGGSVSQAGHVPLGQQVPSVEQATAHTLSSSASHFYTAGAKPQAKPVGLARAKRPSQERRSREGDVASWNRRELDMVVELVRCLGVGGAEVGMGAGIGVGVGMAVPLLRCVVQCLTEMMMMMEVERHRPAGLEESSKSESRERREAEEEGEMLDQGRVLVKHIHQLPSCGGLVAGSLWDSFVTVALRTRLSSPQMLGFLASLVPLAYGCQEEQQQEGARAKARGHGDVTPEVMCSMLWSHPEFTHVMCSACDTSHDKEKKAGLVGLALAVVRQDPGALCQDSHVPLLLSAYSASLTSTDQGILYLLSLYEGNGVQMGKYKPFLWGQAALDHFNLKEEVGWFLRKRVSSSKPLEVLDPSKLAKSACDFPFELEIEPAITATDVENPECYDPRFLLPLFYHLLDPGNLVDSRMFVDVGCLSYVMASLSSFCEGVRQYGYCCLSRLWKHLESSKFIEKPQVMLLMEVLRNSVSTSNQRLPHLNTAFVSRVAELALHPERHLYLVINHFMLYKPSLDLKDIPLFMTLLHSSSPQHHQERTWLLRLLTEGLRCGDDYTVYRKRRVLPQVMSLYGTSAVDKTSQDLILELVRKACRIPVVANDLVWNGGILSWLHGIAGREKLKVMEILLSLWKTLHDYRHKIPPLFEEDFSLTLS